VRIRSTLPAVAALAALATAPAVARADACAGASACPYTAATVIGQRGEGVLRFPQAVAVGADGNVYVGDQFTHAVQVFTPDGQFVRQMGVAGTAPGQLDAVGGVSVASDGSVYVADSQSRINRFNPDGSFFMGWGHRGSGLGQFRFGSGYANSAGAGGGVAAVGGAVYVADTGNHRVQRFGSVGEDASEIIPPGTLLYPQGLAVSGDRLIVADDQHHRLVVTGLGGGLIKTIGTGPGPGPGQLRNPYDVAVDGFGRLLVADDSNHRVVRFSGPPDYPYRARWGTYGFTPGQVEYPRAIAADTQGNSYVADTGNNRIDVFDAGGSFVRAFGTNGRAPGQFIVPMGVATDASGLRAVADSVVGRVQLLNPDGSVAAVFGSPAPGPTILQTPVAVAFDPAGLVYALDQRKSRITVFDRAGNIVREIGSLGSGWGQLESPSALTIVGSTIYVADTGNGRIVRFGLDGSPQGSIGDFTSVRGVAVSPDGQRIYASDAATSRIYVLGADGSEQAVLGGRGRKPGKFDAPAQLALDAGGNLWVVDRGNNRIQQFGPDDKPIQMFGQRGTGSGEFVHPSGITVDCHGQVTVTDTDNNRVQQFALASPAPATCGSLPAVTNPPAPKFPTLPPAVGPQLSVRVLRATKLFTQRTVPLRVASDRPTQLTFTVTLTPRSKPRKKGQKPVVVGLKAQPASLPAGRSQIVRPVLAIADMRKLRAALKGRKGLVVDVQVTGTSADSDPTVATQHMNATG
jgi:tripartite motif-containing protein 71